MPVSADLERIDALTHSPDGESRGLLVRVGDVFPLDPTPAVHAAASAAPSRAATRPWGLRFARVPKARRADEDRMVVYDPVRQLAVDGATNRPAFKHKGGTKETTGYPDRKRPGPEETTRD